MDVGTATSHFGVTTRITRVGFADGWTGAVAIGTIAYVAAAIWFTLSDLPPSPALDFYRLISDQPAAFAATPCTTRTDVESTRATAAVRGAPPT